MKSPELRKELSELVLHKRGIRINLQLSLIESEDEIALRDADTLARRIIALCLLQQFVQAESTQKATLRDAISAASLQEYFSENELKFITANTSDGHQTQLNERELKGEALRFLLWASGLQSTIGMPDGQVPSETVLTALSDLPQNSADLAKRIRLRSKSAMLDWADLLYRLHWAVRHAHITGKPTPGRLDADAVHEWHKAVNWVIQYDDENNWDQVSTETAG
ncbi:DUF4272 domain-containing protein [Undibacterium sp. RuRC25W]|uniref:DUF4272 domain-containing protein n=1 Tax=Undibacterium sp. RuRC25W TaxID=3413047 RepID=UPI003BF350C7